MKKNWSHNHPSVMAWTHDHEMAKRRGETLEPHVANFWKERKRRDLIARIETGIGFVVMIVAFFTSSWMAENNAPVWMSIIVFFSMLGFALALFMENAEDDDLS